jgi:superfamily II DNA/RNA helicase
MRQGLRQKVLRNFRDGKLQALIATDVAARGIDVAGLSHVVNFDLTDTPEAYVHRIGRTGRAGLGGLAISFCSPSEEPRLAAIISVVGARVELFDLSRRASHRFSGKASPPQTRTTVACQTGQWQERAGILAHVNAATQGRQMGNGPSATGAITSRQGQRMRQAGHP